MPRAMELEQRVRVLEQIVTDRGAETAAQIEALAKRRSVESVASRLPPATRWLDRSVSSRHRRSNAVKGAKLK